MMALLSEYFIMNNVFCKRHLWIFLFVMIVYFINNMIFVANGFLPYGKFNDWKSFGGIITPILSNVLAILMFYFMDWVTRQKLMMTSKNGKSIYSLNSM